MPQDTSVSTAAGTANGTPSSSVTSTISLNGASVPNFDSSRPFAVSYAPYNSAGQCKSVAEIASDLARIAAASFQGVRIYGTDCNQVPNVLQALRSIGSELKLFLGIYDLGATTSETDAIISAVNGDWSQIFTISVGNEPVNNGIATPDSIVALTSAVRNQLRAYTFQWGLA
jgi:exo-beta-1,3-glucanase (GH17 family)